MTAQNGGCHCGAVRFETTGSPRFVQRCHCQTCRRTTGGAFSTWVGFQDSQVRWSGVERSFYASSEGVERGYCRNCGTPLSYQGERWAGETHFLIGAFDDARAFTPTGDHFAEEALPWCAPEKV